MDDDFFAPLFLAEDFFELLFFVDRFFVAIVLSPELGWFCRSNAVLLSRLVRDAARGDRLCSCENGSSLGCSRCIGRAPLAFIGYRRSGHGDVSLARHRIEHRLRIALRCMRQSRSDVAS